MYKRVKNGEKLSGIWEYLNHFNTASLQKCSGTTVEAFCDPKLIKQALENMSLFTIVTTVETMQQSTASKKEQMNAVYALDIVKMAQLHIKTVTVGLGMSKMVEIKDEKLRGHVQNLMALLGLTYMQEYSSIGYESGYFQKGTTSLINQAIKVLLTRLRPQLIPLVEMSPITDNHLMSAIGNSYGDIYETHLEWAQTSRMNDNKGSIPVGWNDYIMPILHGKL